MRLIYASPSCAAIRRAPEMHPQRHRAMPWAIREVDFSDGAPEVTTLDIDIADKLYGKLKKA